MKKILSLILLIAPILSYGQTCPPPQTIYIKKDNVFVVVPPTGWRLSGEKWHSIESSNVKFVLAAYGADMHTPRNEDNHIRCYYGNPDLSPNLGIALETIDVIPESALSSHHEWYKSEHYYMCGRTHNVSECHFD